MSLCLVAGAGIILVVIGSQDTIAKTVHTFIWFMVVWILVLVICWTSGVFLLYVTALPRRIMRERRRRRLAGGQCLICGYDLTGNVSGVCPECGRSVA